MYDHELDSSRAKSKFKLAGKHLEARILQGIGRRAPQSWNRIAGLMPQKTAVGIAHPNWGSEP